MTDAARHHHVECVIGIVLTGGTIGAHEDNLVLSVAEGPTQAETALIELQRMWPGPESLRTKVDSPLRKLSENLEPSDWLTIAASVRQLIERDNVDGVLVLHGTDTMAYTAAALSFLLCDLDRPVVMTGAKLPTGDRGSDARRNVHTALVALHDLSAGVYVAFAGDQNSAGKVHLGTRVRKLKASGRTLGRAFRSVNRRPVGAVEDGHFTACVPYTPERHTGFTQALNDRVLALYLYPGLDLELIFEKIIDAGTFRGVVIELYPSATGPDTQDQFSVPMFIARCAERDVVVVTTTAEAPEKSGRAYETTIAIKRAGGILLEDMTSETATVKLMWALAQCSQQSDVSELMQRSIAGEIGR
jgi:L-asparaginase type I